MAKYAIQQRFYHVGKGWSEWSIDFDRTFDNKNEAEQAIEDDNLSETAQYQVAEITYKPQTWMQEKILSEKGYVPYCGNSKHCDMPRTYFDPRRMQFVCPHCGWVSKFPEECMKEYAELNK